MDFATLLAVILPLAFIIYWVTDLVKDLTNGNWNGVLTKVVAFAGAFIVVSAYAHSSIDLGDTASAARVALSKLGWTDLALLSAAIAAGGGAFADFLRARNHADPTVAARLLPGNVVLFGRKKAA